MSVSVGKVPPCDLDAEAAMLSAMLLDGAAVDVVRDHAAPDDCYSDANRRIFQAILEVLEHSTTADIVTVAGWLRAEGRLEQIGGAKYLAQIADTTPAIAHVAAHAELVRKTAVQRRALADLQVLIADAYAHPGRVGEWLEELERTVFAVVDGQRTRLTGEAMAELVASEYADIGRAARGEITGGRTTGFDKLDELTGGFVEGDLWYLAGRPGMGKTALAYGMARSALLPPEDVEPDAFGVFFSLEMTRKQVGQRSLSFESGVPLGPLRRGRLEPKQWTALASALEHVSALPLIVDPERQLTPARIRSRLRRYVAQARKRWPKARLRLVVVDYLQLLGTDLGEGSTNEKLEDTSRKLKLVAGEFECCVVALSQLNREVEKRNPKDKRPTLADLRGSGAVEQDGDNILFIYRDDEYKAPGAKKDGTAELILRKGRNSGQGLVWAKFEGACTRFSPYGEAQRDLDYAGGDDGAAE